MRKTFILILFAFIASPAYSQASKLRVGVLDFNANNISKSEAQIVGEIFTSELVTSGRFDVVDRKNIESLMAEMEFQMSGCTDSACAVEIGQILSLDYMMYGSINKLGESFIINIYMINVETTQIETKTPFSHHNIELGVGYVSGIRESGFEIEALYRFMPLRFFGFGGGVLLGYGNGIESSSTGEYITEPGLRIGMLLEIYFQCGKDTWIYTIK